jgi:hypothetical protein
VNHIVRRVLSGFAASAFTMIIAAGNVAACSCAGGGAPCSELGRSAAVFVGTPISVKVKEPPATRGIDDPDGWTPVTFTFAVDQSFLGIQDREIEVSTGRGGGDCGYQFKLGTRYVVYAYRLSTNRLGTSICSRTVELDRAQEDIEFLRSLGSRKPGVSISGRVLRQLANVATGNPATVGPMAGMTLLVEGESERKEVLTDDEGRYSLAGLSPGKFRIKLSLPDELFTYKPEQEITVADRGCANVSYQVIDNGRLSGTLLGPDGQPAAKIDVALMDAEHPNVTESWGRASRTDENGRYSFSALPPGKFLLAVNFKRYPQPDDPTGAFPRTYYPGVADIAKAEVISMGAGENLLDRNFHLPTRRAPSVIRGKVVWNDGTPVMKAGISFREVSYHDSQSNYGIDADEQGYFTINGYIGQTFIIEVRSKRPYVGDRRHFEPMERVEPVRVLITKPSEMVNIVITRLR